ncbi:complement C1q tumor necrosis factor-related protein 7-like [Branchiostoma floridae]|uniref:Complement C1q tumor necrosis factor-related protein 7-like n=1 Tax=Branchiostoma floridae TaxID=7739 RepID=A0A9J7LQC9_BRAFL|nr:complement C1q tumor necrosis factor-related protein 7-like [Branchiostoma floridae]
MKMSLLNGILAVVFLMTQVSSQKNNESEKDLTCDPGCRGPMGPPGQRGRPGNKGNMGLPGWRGEVGVRGLPGKPGLRGRRGRPGKAGPEGPPGQKGEEGKAGKRGTKGDKGDPGLSTSSSVPYNLAFSAARTTPIGPAYRNNEVIIFNHVFTNVGNGYDVTTGKFTAPMDGVYVFMYNVHKNLASHGMRVALMRNGDIQVLAEDVSGDPQDMAGNSVILELTEGDGVWLELMLKQAINSSKMRQSTFSGYLLFTQ